MVIDQGLERKLFEVAKEDSLLSDKDEKRLAWLTDQKFVIRYWGHEIGISRHDWGLLGGGIR